MSGPISDQNISKSRLMGSVWWKNCSSEILSLLPFDEMIFVGSLNSESDIICFCTRPRWHKQFCLGYRLDS